MSTNRDIPLPRFRFLERAASSVPALVNPDLEIQQALSGLNLPAEQLRGRRIAVTAGSRGIASLKEIVRTLCAWLQAQRAQPFVFPAMGSHGGATAEGQRQVLAEYGVTPEFVGAEIRSSMETVCLGETPQGFKVFIDRNAWEADAVLVMNRIKPHTDFSGKIESGQLKMMAIGMGKIDGAQECHRWLRKHGSETVIRAVAAKVLESGKILAGLGVVENEFHQICAVRAAPPADIVAQEEEALRLARSLTPRLPFSKLDVLVVDEMGKNISGTGMDTKCIGRGVTQGPKEGPAIGMLYVRDLTPETEGNATGIGMADIIHERVFKKVDLQKTYINVSAALNPLMARLPIYSANDRAALNLALGWLGAPKADEQRLAWIRNTLALDRIVVSERLAREASGLPGWRLAEGDFAPCFAADGNLASPFKTLLGN